MLDHSTDLIKTMEKIKDSIVEKSEQIERFQTEVKSLKEELTDVINHYSLWLRSNSKSGFRILSMVAW